MKYYLNKEFPKSSKDIFVAILQHFFFRHFFISYQAFLSNNFKLNFILFFMYHFNSFFVDRVTNWVAQQVYRLVFFCFFLFFSLHSWINAIIFRAINYTQLLGMFKSREPFYFSGRFYNHCNFNYILIGILKPTLFAFYPSLASVNL